MTTDQRHIHESLEAQRWAAQQASREQSAETLKQNALERWEELFQAGLYTEARRFYFANIAGQE